MDATFHIRPEDMIGEEDRFRVGYRESPTVEMPLARFRELGLGLGLGDVREALIGEGEKQALYRLIGVEYDPSDPANVRTRWMQAIQSEPVAA